MIKRLLVTLLPFLGTSCSDRPTSNDKVQMLDPKQILYTLPTLCDPAPVLEDKAAPASARVLHEDDWRQIEFVPASNYDYIQKELERLAAFKRDHQRGIGWTSIYLRKEHPIPLAAISLQFSALPALSTSDLAVRRQPIRGGFALSKSGEWFIYGQRTDAGGILHLAVSPGKSVCSREFANVLAQIAQASHLLLVDWYTGALVDTKSTDAVLEWTRRH